MKCPWCKEWEGPPAEYAEHLKECSSYRVRGPLGMPPPRVEAKRFVPYNLYGRRGRTIVAKDKNAAVQKAPQNAVKVFSEEYLKRRFGKVPEEMF